MSSYIIRQNQVKLQVYQTLSVKFSALLFSFLEASPKVNLSSLTYWAYSSNNDNCWNHQIAWKTKHFEENVHVNDVVTDWSYALARLAMITIILLTLNLLTVFHHAAIHAPHHHALPCHHACIHAWMDCDVHACIMNTCIHVLHA